MCSEPSRTVCVSVPPPSFPIPQEFKVEYRSMTDENEAKALRSGASELLWRMTRMQIDTSVRCAARRAALLRH
jgi:hypothetical protein